MVLLSKIANGLLSFDCLKVRSSIYYLGRYGLNDKKILEVKILL